MYPKVFTEFVAHQQKLLRHQHPAHAVFFYGQEPGQEVAVDIEQGKTLIVKFLTVGDPHPDGRRTVFFELNGQPRNINVNDLSLEATAEKRAPRPTGRTRADRRADARHGRHRRGPVGRHGPAGQKLLSLEAMKMETTLYAERDGKVAERARLARHASRRQRPAAEAGGLGTRGWGLATREELGG